MLGTVVAKARFGLALARRRDVPASVVSSLVRAAAATYAARGAAQVDASALLDVPEPHAERIWDTVDVAVERSAYYASRLGSLPRAERTVQAFATAIPVTTRADLAAAGAAMWASDVTPVLCCQSSGTTGAAVRVPFAQSDLVAMVATTGVTAALAGTLRPGDRVQVSTGSRAVAGNTVFTRAAMELGCQVLATGQVDPADVLATLLTWRPAVVLVWPSFLGSIVTAAERAGLGPSAFVELRTISTGGEIVTRGLRDRVRAVFGAEVALSEGYGCTETLPVAGGTCEEGHMHFDTSAGHVEFLDLENDTPWSGPGTMARLVITPYHALHRAMPLLRYDAGDIVEPLVSGSCSRAGFPAAIIHGKRVDARRTRQGLVTARQILDVLESIPGAELPVRCGATVTDAGELALEVTGSVNAAEVLTACRDAGLAIASIHSAADHRRLHAPLRRRADLVEQTHGTSLTELCPA